MKQSGKSNKGYNKSRNQKSSSGKIQQESRDDKEVGEDYNDKRDTRGNRGNRSSRRSADNDPNWYAASVQLLEDSASLAYSWPTGTRVDMQVPQIVTDDTNGWAKAMNAWSVPGVMVFDTTLCPGNSYDNTDPVNMAARNIYSFVRHANAGHTNYDTPDLMLYLLAMDSVYSYYAFLVRLYGTIQLYTQSNRYYPRALVSAMHCDYDDLIEHLADLRYFINSYGYKLAMFAVPATMSYFVRHQWIFSNLYVDSTSAKAQTYLFTPHGYHKFIETQGPGKLQYIPFTTGAGSNGMTLDGLIKYGNALIDVIAASEDMNIMSGDILKAYGMEGTFKVAPVPTEYYTLPVYDPEVMTQIENMTILPGTTQDAYTPYPGADTWSQFDITQDPGTNALRYQPYFWGMQWDGSSLNIKMNYCGWAGDRLLTMHQDNLQPADNMVATRLMVPTSVDNVDTDSTHHFLVIRPKHFGSEMVIGGRIFYYFGLEGVPGMTLDSMPLPSYWYAPKNSLEDLFNVLQITTLYETFKGHPMTMFPIVITSESGATEFGVTRLFDIDNYVVLTDADLNKMHQTALLSEFNSPQIAKAQPSNYK